MRSTNVTKLTQKGQVSNRSCCDSLLLVSRTKVKSNFFNPSLFPLADSFLYSWRMSSTQVSCDKLNMKIRVKTQNAHKNEKYDVVTAKMINISVF